MNKFVFGTMRLNELDALRAKHLLKYLLKKGIRKFHSSTEYESFPLFAEQLGKACEEVGVLPNEIDHIIKLASPHFDETEISRISIERMIDQYRTALNVETIHAIQWMARINLKQENLRISLIKNSADLLTSISSKLKSGNAIRQFGCFPYTFEFAIHAIQSGAFDCFIDYYNPSERMCVGYFPFLQEQGMTFYSLRPFFAGKSIGETNSIEDLLRFSLKLQNLGGMIISTNDIEHFDQINLFLNSIEN